MMPTLPTSLPRSMKVLFVNELVVTELLHRVLLVLRDPAALSHIAVQFTSDHAGSTRGVIGNTHHGLGRHADCGAARTGTLQQAGHRVASASSIESQERLASAREIDDRDAC